jgi:ribulose-5-phosphate 4-epimerase/fuculose-1-phosphate aldolase
MPYDSFCEKVLALASVRFIIQNDVQYDLPAAYHESSPVVEEIKKYGRELAGMGLLPTPFPLKEVLSARELRHVYKIFGLTGLSYGNLSAREDVFGNGSASFWVTARGVDKSRLDLVGRDIVLVKGLNQPAGAVMTSVPPFADPTVRASTDAVEHLLIYERFADIHAIVHVHAWMENVLCTRQNYPCGTWELAREVVDLLTTAPNPTRAVIGLKNHGLTVTGRDFADIFDRLRGKLQLDVRMLA